MYFDKLKENDIIIPKELYGTLFVCLILCINHYIENTEFMEEINVHDMFIFSSVDGHNVIRRVD